MQTLIVKTNTTAQATLLANFLKTVPYIKSVVTQKADDSLKPLTAADWVRPGRPATNEELGQMLDECENSPSMTAKEAKAQTMKTLDKWIVQQKR